MALESERERRDELERVARILAPLLFANSYLSRVYDDSVGRSKFLAEMSKIGGMPNFVEKDTT